MNVEFLEIFLKNGTRVIKTFIKSSENVKTKIDQKTFIDGFRNETGLNQFKILSGTLTTISLGAVSVNEISKSKDNTLREQYKIKPFEGKEIRGLTKKGQAELDLVNQKFVLQENYILKDLSPPQGVLLFDPSPTAGTLKIKKNELEHRDAVHHVLQNNMTVKDELKPSIMMSPKVVKISKKFH